MDIAQARQIAETVLAGIDSPDEPLALFPDEQVVDVGWGWVFGYTTARWLETRDPDAVPPPGGGPIVVVEQTGETWMLRASRPYDQQLAEYQAPVALGSSGGQPEVE
ncbi:YrhB domain-containing protein [Saccharothrix variisporea]|uniref:Immunity protein 35 of polymorphic toxin system n=1 Tax=Saccharothrix variisporea TaxID=543527 RepID=A0A495X0J3_9PSEU|nr:YrhB domain-containing protein [Saccharothrix variisporea]RKT67179.1 immunity protein 35 of polymorphic toxin system [Saccharothrix variisporea]